MTELQKFDVWGLVSVEDEKITVIVSSLTKEGKPLNRTIQKTSNHTLNFRGSAIISAELNGHFQGVHEIGETAVMGHPDVEAVFQNALEWLRKSV
jgi:hypothetical protein